MWNLRPHSLRNNKAAHVVTEIIEIDEEGYSLSYEPSQNAENKFGQFQSSNQVKKQRTIAVKRELDTNIEHVGERANKKIKVEENNVPELFDQSQLQLDDDVIDITYSSDEEDEKDGSIEESLSTAEKVVEKEDHTLESNVKEDKSPESLSATKKTVKREGNAVESNTNTEQDDDVFVVTYSSDEEVKINKDTIPNNTSDGEFTSDDDPSEVASSIGSDSDNQYEPSDDEDELSDTFLKDDIIYIANESEEDDLDISEPEIHNDSDTKSKVKPEPKKENVDSATVNINSQKDSVQAPEKRKRNRPRLGTRIPKHSVEEILEIKAKKSQFPLAILQELLYESINLTDFKLAKLLGMIAFLEAIVRKETTVVASTCGLEAYHNTIKFPQSRMKIQSLYSVGFWVSTFVSTGNVKFDFVQRAHTRLVVDKFKKHVKRVLGLSNATQDFYVRAKLAVLRKYYQLATANYESLSSVECTLFDEFESHILKAGKSGIIGTVVTPFFAWIKEYELTGTIKNLEEDISESKVYIKKFKKYVSQLASLAKNAWPYERAKIKTLIAYYNSIIHNGWYPAHNEKDAYQTCINELKSENLEEIIPKSPGRIYNWVKFFETTGGVSSLVAGDNDYLDLCKRMIPALEKLKDSVTGCTLSAIRLALLKFYTAITSYATTGDARQLALDTFLSHTSGKLTKRGIVKAGIFHEYHIQPWVKSFETTNNLDFAKGLASKLEKRLEIRESLKNIENLLENSTVSVKRKTELYALTKYYTSILKGDIWSKARNDAVITYNRHAKGTNLKPIDGLSIEGIIANFESLENMHSSINHRKNVLVIPKPPIEYLKQLGDILASSPDMLDYQKAKLVSLIRYYETAETKKNKILCVHDALQCFNEWIDKLKIDIRRPSASVIRRWVADFEERGELTLQTRDPNEILSYRDESRQRIKSLQNILKESESYTPYQFAKRSCLVTYYENVSSKTSRTKAVYSALAEYNRLMTERGETEFLMGHPDTIRRWVKNFESDGDFTPHLHDPDVKVEYVRKSRELLATLDNMIENPESESQVWRIIALKTYYTMVSGKSSKNRASRAAAEEYNKLAIKIPGTRPKSFAAISNWAALFEKTGIVKGTVV